jgi:hypothetical protein
MSYNYQREKGRVRRKRATEREVRRERRREGMHSCIFFIEGKGKRRFYSRRHGRMCSEEDHYETGAFEQKYLGLPMLKARF